MLTFRADVSVSRLFFHPFRKAVFIFSVIPALVSPYISFNVPLFVHFFSGAGYARLNCGFLHELSPLPLPIYLAAVRIVLCTSAVVQVVLGCTPTVPDLVAYF